MKNIIITIVCLILGACSESSVPCIGDEQVDDVFQYSCVSPNAYIGTTLIGRVDDGNSVSAKLYALDKESVLGVNPANYIVAISSFDIGEPVILIGFKSGYELSMKLEANGDSFVFSLSTSETNVQAYLVEFTDYETFKVNGTPM